MFIQLSADWWFPTEKYESQWEENQVGGTPERRNAIPGHCWRSPGETTEMMT